MLVINPVRDQRIDRPPFVKRKEKDFLQEVKILNTNSCPFVRISKGKILNSAALSLLFSFTVSLLRPTFAVLLFPSLGISLALV
jgi:hypothetical protein